MRGDEGTIDDRLPSAIVEAVTDSAISLLQAGEIDAFARFGNIRFHRFRLGFRFGFRFLFWFLFRFVGRSVLFCAGSRRVPTVSALFAQFAHNRYKVHPFALCAAVMMCAATSTTSTVW